jgi:hypothetical protein
MACQVQEYCTISYVIHTRFFKCSDRFHLYHVFPASLKLVLLLVVVNHIITSHTAVLESIYKIDIYIYI